MKKIFLSIVLITFCLTGAGHVTAQSIQPPTLKWQRGGCYSSWCETGWYSSPAVADLDGNGTMEVIGGGYTLFILNGADGTTRHSVNTPGSRIWPGVVVADLDNNGDLEIVTAQGDGYLNVLDHNGNVVWSQRPMNNELRSLSVGDLDNDSTLEIAVGSARGAAINTWVYEHNGTLRGGWPQPTSEAAGWSWGIFNDNIAIGDIDGDSQDEVIAPSDVHYICAYEANGSPIPAHAMYGGKVWGRVGIWEDITVELRGWGECSGVRAESYRTNFADGPATIADVDGNGTMEIVATGNVYDCHAGYPPSRYVGVYVFNADRSRFNSSGYDWYTTVPVDTGAPLSEDYNVIESAQYNPVVADLDGDGKQEILFSSYDGRVHAYWLDKTEHGAWPYSVYTGSGYRFAGEPAVADLDNDGHAEVIVATWVQVGSNQTGDLIILDYQGHLLHKVALPMAFSGNWNGALAAPTLANIDADPDLEVVLNTAHSGLVAYDLPGTSHARILWGTGRSNYLRNGFLKDPPPPTGSLENSYKHVKIAGGTLAYTIHLEDSGVSLPTVRLTDTLPSNVQYRGDLHASSGNANHAAGVITWNGAVSADTPVELTFSATVISETISIPTTVFNTVYINDGQGNVLQRQAVAIVNGRSVYLPVIMRHP
ncbi:MAG: VCBS repeat-containing protein [Anaerolineae bacterium]|nr:VCBS repeat-containing protein [Anaerolineae bacterium]